MVWTVWRMICDACRLRLQGTPGFWLRAGLLDLGTQPAASVRILGRMTGGTLQHFMDVYPLEFLPEALHRIMYRGAESSDYDCDCAMKVNSNLTGCSHVQSTAPSSGNWNMHTTGNLAFFALLPSLATDTERQKCWCAFWTHWRPDTPHAKPNNVIGQLNLERHLIFKHH